MNKSLLLIFTIALALGAWFFLLQEHTGVAFDWVRDKGLMGGVVAGLVYALATVLMIPGSVATLAIGAIYGPWIGLLIVSPASVLGATMAFVLGRGVFRPTIEKRMQGSNKFKALQAAISDNGLKILTLVRLSPIFPFTVINYAFGLTRISLRKYILGSFVGMLPGTLLYVYLGSAVGDVGQLMSDGVQDSGRAGSLMFYGGLVATAAVTIIITKVAKQALADATTSTSKNNDTITK
jgi:uncharacterized membrane protein YdjX (TVP38/TMEM64 family)